MNTYKQQLQLCTDLMNKIDAEEKAIKADVKAGKITREQAEELMEMPHLWNEYRPAAAVLQYMKEAEVIKEES
jgi:hypothetical protein